VDCGPFVHLVVCYAAAVSLYAIVLLAALVSMQGSMGGLQLSSLSAIISYSCWNALLVAANQLLAGAGSLFGRVFGCPKYKLLYLVAQACLGPQKALVWHGFSGGLVPVSLPGHVGKWQCERQAMLALVGGPVVG
jgi:hypothetical protein